MRFSAALVALLVGSAIALPSSDHVILERRSEAASTILAKRYAAPLDHVISMKIALAQKNLHQIPQLLDDVSNPKSPNYGKHWTGDELNRKFAPGNGSIRAVVEWLKSAGFDAKLSRNRHWIEFEATIEEAEKLLKTKYFVYGNSEDAKNHVGCDEYSVPGHVRDHIDIITPTVSTGELKRSTKKRDSQRQGRSGSVQMPTFKPFGSDGAQGAESPAPKASNNTAPSIGSCSLGVTPDCIKAIYDIPKGETATAGNQLGIYECEDYYDQNDLDAFFSTYAPKIHNGTAPVLNSIDGGLASPGAGEIEGESVLDLEVSYPIIHPQGVRLFQVDDPAYTHSSKKGHFDSLLDALDASFCSFMGGDNSTFDFTYPDNNQTNGYNGTKMCGTYSPPTVLSISYGYLESQFSDAYLQRQCLEFAKLSMAGTTVVVSSGDSGVSAPYCANPTYHVASPQFPASCPYVTTVGATMLNQNAANSSLQLTDNGSEVVADDPVAEFKAGSGFSAVFETPVWQKEAVNGYLLAVSKNGTASNSSKPMVPGTNFNSKGRAYPDVSVIGTNVTTITNQRSFNADGTSASAPIFASMITLINEERMSAGKGPVGFINPALYQAKGNRAVFKDITSGNNGNCGLGGFSATKGWDAVSGWGSPRYEGLRDLLMSLP